MQNKDYDIHMISKVYNVSRAESERIISEAYCSATCLCKFYLALARPADKVEESAMNSYGYSVVITLLQAHQ